MVAVTYIAFGLLAVASTAIAAPTEASFASKYPYSRPAGASRGPCPALNILANHGLLPRDGRGITLEKLQASLSEAFNFTPDTTATVFSIQNNPVTGLNATSFALEDIKKHTPFVVEHDASISRNDFDTSKNNDNFSFNRTLFANSFQYVIDKGFTQLNSTAMAHIRQLRETQSEIYNPKSAYGRLDVNPDGSLVVDPSKQEFFAIGEAAFVLDMFGSNNGLPQSTTSMADIAIMFAAEAFPPGYTKPSIEVTLPTVLARAAEIKAALLSLPPIPKAVAANYWDKDFTKTVATKLRVTF